MPSQSFEDLFRLQHGVVSRQQVLAANLTDRQIARKLASGRWLQEARGVYRHSLIGPTWQSRLLVATMQYRGVASHLSAAVLHNFEDIWPGTPHILVPRGRARSAPGVHLHETTQWDRIDPTTIRSIPCTGLTRTVIDLAASVGPHRLEGAVDALIREDILTWPDLRNVLIDHARRGRDGCGKLRALLEIRYGDSSVPLSNWSRRVQRLLTDANCGLAVLEYTVRDQHDRWVAQVDLAYPADRVAIELDSVRWHFNKTSFQEDPRRRNRLIVAGWTVLHFTWRDYQDHPDRLCETVRRARNLLSATHRKGG